MDIYVCVCAQECRCLKGPRGVKSSGSRVTASVNHLTWILRNQMWVFSKTLNHWVISLASVVLNFAISQSAINLGHKPGFAKSQKLKIHSIRTYSCWCSLKRDQVNTLKYLQKVIFFLTDIQEKVDEMSFNLYYVASTYPLPKVLIYSQNKKCGSQPSIVTKTGHKEN